jgi:hypothetical protein
MGLRLGDLLVSAKIVRREDVERAVAYQQRVGGRLGDALIAIGAVSQSSLEEFLHRIPPEPETIQETGIPATELLNLMLKQIHLSRLETTLQFTDAMKVAPRIVDELVREAVARGLLAAMGSMGSAMRYELSERGRGWAQEALKMSQYAGPAPVTLDAFCARVHLQKVTNERVTFDKVRAALRGYTVTDDFVKEIGPALNAGRAMLMYGPPGNGKTSVAQSFAEIFASVIYLPYAVMIEGQIMRVFDPSLHMPVTNTGEPETFAGLRRDHHDLRWVPVKRPFIVTGGELTLEMLDLSYDHATGFYEAPLHIKSLGGCFVVDDFGRQIVSPTTLLNRWIVPMESRVDYLKLHTGKSFSLPFEAMLIFSTNIDPEDLMDPAFLRRLPYKVEVGAPSLETYFSIFKNVCDKRGITLTNEAFKSIVYKVVKEKGMELAAYHATFIVDQAIAISKFMDIPPTLDDWSIDYALKNLKVRPRAPKSEAA